MIVDTEKFHKNIDRGVSKLEYEGYLDYSHSSVVMGIVEEEIKKEDEKYIMPEKVEEALDWTIEEGQIKDVYSLLDYFVQQRGIEEVTDWIFGSSENMEVFVLNYIKRKREEG